MLTLLPKPKTYSSEVPAMNRDEFAEFVHAELDRFRVRLIASESRQAENPVAQAA